MSRFLIATWGMSGMALLLLDAVVRLMPIALEALFSGSMQPLHWVFFVLWMGIMGYTEGYRGFYKRVGPLTAARAFYLADERPQKHLILAPIFCMAMYHADRRTLIVRWCLLFGIISLVLIVRQMPQPLRGIVDAGVVFGLSMGLVSLLIFYVRGLFGLAEPISDLPESPPPVAIPQPS